MEATLCHRVYTEVLRVYLASSQKAETSQGLYAPAKHHSLMIASLGLSLELRP